MVAIPPTKPPRSRREESAPANGVVETVEEFPLDEVVGLVCGGVTMFEVTPLVELNGVVTVEEVVALPVPLLFEELPAEVEEADVTLAEAAPIEKVPEVEKTSVMLPMLTASNV